MTFANLPKPKKIAKKTSKKTAHKQPGKKAAKASKPIGPPQAPPQGLMEPDAADSGSPPPPPEPDILRVRVDLIDVPHQNIRRAMDAQKLKELTESMAAIGLEHDIGLAALPGAGGRYGLIWGHRRLVAAKTLGWETIAAKVYTGLSHLEILLRAVAENVQHEDLTPMDEARTVEALVEEGLATHTIAAKLDKCEDWCRRRQDLLRLDPKVQDLVASGRIPVKHGFLLSRIGDKKVQVREAEGVLGCSFQQGLAKGADKSDYVSPLSALRSRIALLLRKLGGCGWPMDEEYAGRRPCSGCPDNTASEPTLFEDVKIESAHRKGNCTNAACYTRKKAAWDKVLSARRAAKKQSEAEIQRDRAARKKAAVAGVCWRCGRGEPDEAPPEWREKTLCPRCAKTAAKEAAAEEKKVRRGSGSTSEGGRDEKPPWPNTPEELYHEALEQYANEVAKRICIHATSDAVPAEEVMAVGVRLVMCTRWFEWENSVSSKAESVAAWQELAAELATEPGPIAVGRERAVCVLGDIVRSPLGSVGAWQRTLDDEDLGLVECVLALGLRWKIDAGRPRPELADFAVVGKTSPEDAAAAERAMDAEMAEMEEMAKSAQKPAKRRAKKKGRPAPGSLLQSGPAASIAAGVLDAAGLAGEGAPAKKRAKK